MAKPIPEQIETLGYLLRTNYDLLQRQIYAALHQAGHLDVRQAHSSVLRYLPVEGARMTVLAKQAGISKQSIAYLVDDLCRLGYLELREDPADGRAKQVYYTRKGQDLVALLAKQSRLAEQDFAKIIGKQQMEIVRASLTAFIKRSTGN